MWTLAKIAWRNLFRQRRRTAITVSAMVVSLIIAIPYYGLVEGLSAEMLKGITRLELGHVQLHDPAYPKGRALQSTLRRPERLLAEIRGTTGVVAAAPRVHGSALASHDHALRVLLRVSPVELTQAVRFGRPIKPEAPWRADPALACEALVEVGAGRAHAIAVGTVLTPTDATAGGACERVRIVGLAQPTKAMASGGQASALSVFLDAEDLQRAFGRSEVAGSAVLRHSAAIALEGIDPPQERKITFMAEKVVEGRYLSPQAKDEVVVGYRLARVLRLSIGSKLFVQAASLDNTGGSFYQDLTVVGIYRTGVDMIDRSRVFLHVADAQRIMALDQRVHEIAITGQDAKLTKPLVDALRERVGRQRLTVTAGGKGLRAHSRPLPAPIAVYEPQLRSQTSGVAANAQHDAELLIPYDLKRRFDGVEGLERTARRVYAQTDVAAVRAVEVTIASIAGKHLPRVTAQPCTVFTPSDGAKRLGLGDAAVVVPQSSADGNGDGCAQLTVRVIEERALRELSRPGGPPRSRARALVLYTAALEHDATDQDSAAARVAPGKQTVFVAATASGLGRGSGPGLRSVRVVGVETALEPQLSGLPARIAHGAYFDAKLPDKTATEDESWPVLVPERVAQALGADVGATVLLRTRDADNQSRWQSGRVVGVLADAKWSSELPELVLPYFSAQQIDAPRLNARAHEILLIPTVDSDVPALVSRVSSGLAPLVRSWQQVAPDMAKLLATQDAWIGVVLLIIFAIAAITVMNTMLMAVFERTKEFGVLKSVGMKPWQVFGLISIETLAIAVIALVIGGAGGSALSHYLTVHGIDLTAWTSGFTYQGTFIDPVWRTAVTIKTIVMPLVMVALVCFGVSLYPAFRAGRIKPVEALRHRG